MVSIIILNKNKPELIEPCLKSILNNVNLDKVEILIGDTGSHDVFHEKIYLKYEKESNNRVKVIKLGYYNFSKNNNTLVKHSNGDFLFFLNNDTYLFSDVVTELSNFINENPEVGIVGPKLQFGHNYKIQQAGIEFYQHPIYGIVGYHPNANRHESLPDVNQILTVPAVTGAALFLRKKDFDDVGGFDEKYQSEAQDVDLCFKVASRGRKIVYNGFTRLLHLENGTRAFGEENIHDRKYLVKKWKGHLDKILSSRIQSKGFAKDRSFKKYILIERLQARGDVLAAIRLCKKIKENEPESHITFKTVFTDLVDSNSFVDRVIHISEIDNWVYDEQIKPNYENSGWDSSNLKWLEQMSVSINRGSTIKDEKIEIHFSEYDRIIAQTTFNKIPAKYIVVSTGAGWPEREWNNLEWSMLVRAFNEKGIAVVQIGGLGDFEIPGAIVKLNRNLQINYEIIRRAIGAVLLDSFPLHIAMMTDTPVLLLTCKTCSDTIWLRKSVKEIRNIWIDKTPKPECKTRGCRLRYGNGLENKCSYTILNELRFEKVFSAAKKHFSIDEVATETP